MATRKRALVREVNPHLICVLCSGYFIEATTIVECLHSFCRSCLVKYLENSKFCPICDVQLHKNNPLLSVRCDSTLQQLVYKLIPGLYGKEMARRRKYYSELGGPSSDPECSEFPVGDAYFSPEDSISLSLEFINYDVKEEDASGNEEDSIEKQVLHHRRYLQCPAAVTMSHLKKFLRMKYGLNQDHNVDIMYSGEVLTDDFSLMDVAYTFCWNRVTPMRFKFRLLQKNTFPQEVGNKEEDVALKNSNATHPAPPASSLFPGNYEETKRDATIRAKTLTVQVQRLPNANEIMPSRSDANGIKKNIAEQNNDDLKRHFPVENTPIEGGKDTLAAPEAKKAKFNEALCEKEKPDEKPFKKDKDKSEEKIVKKLKEKLDEKSIKKEKEKHDEKKYGKDKDKQEEKSLRRDKDKHEDKITKKEKEKLFEKSPIVEPVKIKHKEKHNYLDDIEQEEAEIEERTKETSKVEITPHPESMIVEENVEPQEVEMEGLPKLVEQQRETVSTSRSEERRKEKKKNKKAKHHHHHRHHDKKRDSPPAATILHSPENDIMKLKIKLTDISSKPKYSVVDSSDDKKEFRENGHNHKVFDKKHEEKHKQRHEEAKKIENNDATHEKSENLKPRSENSNKDKFSQMKSIKHKTSPKSPPPSLNMSPKQNSLSPNPKHYPMIPSPKHNICTYPKPNNSSPPNCASPKISLSPKPNMIQPKQNGARQTETIKMPPSSITVSKITAAEKRQMEQQKLLMNRNNNNGGDSKRPSLEIMLVNAPKKGSDGEMKPVEVKKVIRPTPPSIPLSRLNKPIGFGPKGSPPPLVPTSNSKSNSLDESGALDLSGKSSRKSPDMESAMRNLVTLSDTAVHIRNMNMLAQDHSPATLKIPNISLNNKTAMQGYQPQRTIKPGPNQTVRQIPNPSALMFRHHNLNGRTIPPPGVPINSLRKIESITKNIEKVAAGLSVKAAVEAGYCSK